MTSKRRRLKGRKGEYLVLAELARGGISAVHLARVKDAEGTEQFVIFRELLPHLSQEQESVDRFLKEAKITYQFDHPNLVPTQEVVKMQAGYFSISEFLVGDGLGFVLATALKAGLDLPMRLAAEWTAQACEGVGFAHLLGDKQGLIHKNINLRNLIVLPSGRVKVVNFDIARPENRPHPTRVTAYMSPEQCVGKQLDARTDVFSLGVVFWELLTRCHLFMREDDMETRRAVMACKVAPVSEFRSEVKPELADIAMRALNKDPAQRFENAAEMAKALRAAQVQPPDPKQAQEYLDEMMSERFQAKLSMLEKIEASEDAEVDPGVLLPNASVDLPPVPEDDPHGFDREPVTQKDRDKKKKKEKKEKKKKGKETPPSLPPKPADKSEAEQAEAMPPPPMVKEEKQAEKKEEKKEEKEENAEKTVTPPPFKPSIRVRKSFQKYLLPGAIAAGVLIVVLIVIAAWPSGDETGEAEGVQPLAAEAEAAVVAPEPVAEEGAKEDPKKKPGLAVLEIVTDPKGCRVLLDTLELEGKTPLQNVIIPADTEYRVLVKCKGYKQESREVVARPGERLKLKIIPPPMKER